VPLPIHIPEVYEVHTRRVDVEVSLSALVDGGVAEVFDGVFPVSVSHRV